MTHVFQPLDHAIGFGEVLSEVGKASHCVAGKTHSPKPLRFVWHHILPQACGGTNISSNLASLCDNCHYGVHALMYNLAVHGGKTSAIFGRFAAGGRYELALQGYNAALAAGVVNLIPNEGGSAD